PAKDRCRSTISNRQQVSYPRLHALKTSFAVRAEEVLRYLFLRLVRPPIANVHWVRLWAFSAHALVGEPRHDVTITQLDIRLAAESTSADFPFCIRAFGRYRDG
ncbi:MAG: hypothetical protein ABW061_17925, partial [Polyangiaceae bacterium]